MIDELATYSHRDTVWFGLNRAVGQGEHRILWVFLLFFFCAKKIIWKKNKFRAANTELCIETFNDSLRSSGTNELIAPKAHFAGYTQSVDTSIFTLANFCKVILQRS